MGTPCVAGCGDLAVDVERKQARIGEITLSEGDPITIDGTTGEVIVDDRQLSLAIGKEGQNARLAAKLTGLRIDIKSLSAVEEAEPALQISAEPDVKRETPIWEEIAQQEAAAAAAKPAAAISPAEEVVAAVAETEAPEEPVAPAATAAPQAPAAPERAGAVRFASEVLPAAQPVEPRGGTRRRASAGGGRRGPAGREAEEAARRRGGGRGARGATGRRSLDEEIEEELEAALEGEDFDFFGMRDEEDK
jgi:N utilization substance protein A